MSAKTRSFLFVAADFDVGRSLAAYSLHPLTLTEGVTEERFLWAHSLRGYQSITVGKAWWWEFLMLLAHSSGTRKQKKELEAGQDTALKGLPQAAQVTSLMLWPLGSITCPKGHHKLENKCQNISLWEYYTSEPYYTPVSVSGILEDLDRQFPLQHNRDSSARSKDISGPEIKSTEREHAEDRDNHGERMH